MEILSLLGNIIKKYMNLDDSQVWVYDQKQDIPPDDRLYVVLEFVGQSVIGSNRKYDDSGEGLTEVVSVNMFSQVSVDIFSSSNENLLRKEEVVMALNSTLSQQTQEKYGFSIARGSFQFNDASVAEASEMLKRYNISFNVTHVVEKENAVDYYNDFPKPEIKTEA